MRPENLTNQMINAIGNEYLKKYPKKTFFHSNQNIATELASYQENNGPKDKWEFLIKQLQTTLSKDSGLDVGVDNPEKVGVLSQSIINLFSEAGLKFNPLIYSDLMYKGGLVSFSYYRMQAIINSCSSKVRSYFEDLKKYDALYQEIGLLRNALSQSQHTVFGNSSAKAGAMSHDSNEEKACVRRGPGG